MYDERETIFKAPQVGSFFEVHRVEDEHGVSLVGTARINKRNPDVTDEIISLYDQGKLKFSFEIWASELTEEDGIIVVDAVPGNRLTAMAIVTTPALPAAVALNLAAELDIDAFREKVWHLMDAKFRYPWQMLWIGMEYAVVYLMDCGHMMRVDYRLDGNELIETGMTEVEFKEVEQNMDKNLEAAATNVETPDVAETTAIAEGVANLNTVETEAGACGDPEKGACGDPEKGACGDNEKGAIENDIDDDLKNESDTDAHDLEEMRMELERTKAELAQYKEAEAKAKLAEKQAAARKYAEREHLDLNAENVKAAIENADYEALAAEVMAKPVDNKDNEEYRVTAEMKVTSPFGNMFETSN